jgi:hypothetical protein
MLDSLLCSFIVFVLSHLPGGLHHGNEVILGRSGSRKVGVVVSPLIPLDNTIIVSAHTIELIEEISQDLILGLFSIKELFILRNIINTSNIASSELSGAIFVHHHECFLNHG